MDDELGAFARLIAAGELKLRALQKGHVVDLRQREKALALFVAHLHGVAPAGEHDLKPLAEAARLPSCRGFFGKAGEPFEVPRDDAEHFLVGGKQMMHDGVLVVRLVFQVAVDDDADALFVGNGKT